MKLSAILLAATVVVDPAGAGTVSYLDRARLNLLDENNPAQAAEACNEAKAIRKNPKGFSDEERRFADRFLLGLSSSVPICGR